MILAPLKKNTFQQSIMMYGSTVQPPAPQEKQDDEQMADFSV
jgi:hypothetical protein